MTADGAARLSRAPTPSTSQRCGDDHLDADAVPQGDAEGRRRAKSADKGASWEEQKRERNRIAALPAKRDKLLARIDVAEARKKEIARALRGSDVLSAHAADGDRWARHRRARALDEEIEKLVAEWEAIEAEISASG